MKNLDWYIEQKEETRRQMFDLAWYLYPDKETIHKNILPRAVDIARKNLRTQKNALTKSVRHRRIFLSEGQLLQAGLMHAVEELEELGIVTPTRVRCWIWYVKHLFMNALLKDSFHVAACLGKILANGSERQVLDLYSFLGRDKDDRNMRKIIDIYRKRAWKQYRSFFSEEGEALAFEECRQSEGDEIFRVLARLTPWQSRHLSDLSERWEEKLEEDDLVHAWTDPPCFQIMKIHFGYANDFNLWRLPVYKGKEGEETPPVQPGWDEESIIKEVLYWEWSRKHGIQKRSRNVDAFSFNVKIDRLEVSSDALTRMVFLPLPPTACMMEVVAQETGELLASCFLMEPEYLPPEGWNLSCFTDSGTELDFSFHPTADQERPLYLRVGHAQWQFSFSLLWFLLSRAAYRGFLDLFKTDLRVSHALSGITPLGPDYHLARWQPGDGQRLANTLIVGFFCWPLYALILVGTTLLLLDIGDAVKWAMVETIAIALTGCTVCGITVSLQASTAGGLGIAAVLGTGYGYMIAGIGGIPVLLELMQINEKVLFIIGGVEGLVRPPVLFVICFSLALGCESYLMGNTSVHWSRGGRVRNLIAIVAGVVGGAIPVGLGVRLNELLNHWMPEVAALALMTGTMAGMGLGIAIGLKTRDGRRALLFGLVYCCVTCLITAIAGLYWGTVTGLVLGTIVHVLFQGCFFALAYVIAERLAGRWAGSWACALEGIGGFVIFLIVRHWVG